MQSKATSPQNQPLPQRGFTIVELLVVIVVIAIPATISIISYNGIITRAAETTLKSDLSNDAQQLELENASKGTYPDSEATANDGNGLAKSPGTTLYYSKRANGSYCVTATSSRNGVSAFMISTDNPTPRPGSCPGHPEQGGSGGSVAAGTKLQAITAATCPSSRTRAVDARDNRTYWVQKLADGKCWMLTNLAYAGGGENTYGDVKTLTNGTNWSTTAPYYYTPPGTNLTSEPTDPSTSTNGTGQYGYLYNWCAAMGGQATAACANASTPAPNPSISICPTGWRLPTGNGGDFTALNAAVNGSSTTSRAGLESTWLHQRSGSWEGGFYGQGSSSFYWSSTGGVSAYVLQTDSYSVYLSNDHSKDYGYAVRCVGL